MKWTDKQQQAIDLRGQNMLVSAAAGSGKTAVLVERIKQLIIRDQVGLDQLLIVTFTNAAASEMKEKIISAVTKEIELNPKDSGFLRKQLNIVGSANISTFHSFALEVIRRYFYLTDVEPNFKIGDEGTIEIMKGQVMDELFHIHFEEGGEGFRDFLKAYSSDRNDHAIKEHIQKLYTTIQSIPEPLGWLESRIEDMKGELADSNLMGFIKLDVTHNLQRIIASFEQACVLAEGVESIYQKCCEDLDTIQMLSTENLDDFGKQLGAFKANTLRAAKEEKEIYADVKEEIKQHRDYGKKLIKNLLERYFSQPIEGYEADMKAVYPMACYLQELIRDFDRMFKAAKGERNLLDFNDIEHYALKILENDTAAAEYREKFAYIFVDEYQDSNLLQDTLIHRIKRENNLFMVGDIKQSIYKFRLAEPEIFQEKYERYRSEDTADSTKIDLNQNFRSKRAVIETVNGIFENIMNNYDADAALYQGVPYEGPIDYKTQLHIVDSSISEDMELGEDIAEMKNAELEAYAAAEIIKDAIGTVIFDVKQGKERPLTRRDIVILMRGMKNYADIFQRVFTELDIPSYMDDSGGYFDTVEIEVFMNLLRLIDNRKQDLPLLSVMRSSILNFSIEELIEIRLIDGNITYYEAVLSYSREGLDPALQEKCARLFAQLDEWTQMAQSFPLEDLVWQLMWETGYYTYCGALPAGEQRQANLRALVDKARDFQQNNYSGIYGFLTYIKAMEKRSVSTGQVKLVGENDDIVRIMTIHKSKGLEFPMVIVAGLGKRFNVAKSGKGFLAHKDLGIGLTYVNYEAHWYRKTLMQTAIEQKMRKEDLEEELRILYVAFTRAMDRLVLLGTSRKVKDGELQASLSQNSFIDYVIPYLEEGQIDFYLHDRSEIHLDNQSRAKNREELDAIFEDTKVEPSDLSEEIDRRLSFRYFNEHALSIKSKYAVTELSSGEQAGEKEQELKAPLFLQEKRTFTAAEKGTLLHSVMEYIDFRETCLSKDKMHYVREQIAKMQSCGLLLEEEAAAIEPKRIVGFFESELGKRAGKSQVYKETEFNLLKEMDGTEIMVQGVIDCYFEETDGLVLIDYKSSYVDWNDKDASIELIKDRYREQIEIYKEALEATQQKNVKEAYLYLFRINESVCYT